MLLEQEAVLSTITAMTNLHCVEENSDTWKFAEDLIKAIQSADGESRQAEVQVKRIEHKRIT